MKGRINRRTFLGTAGAALAAAGMLGPSIHGLRAQTKIRLRLSSPALPTDHRAVALVEVFGPAVAGFATFEPRWNLPPAKRGAELEAISLGDLEMFIASPEDLATTLPEFSIFVAGYLHRDAEHQRRVFASDFMQPLKSKAESVLGVKLLSVMYLGRRHLNLRGDKQIGTPADLAGINLRVPWTDARQFLGKALGANPVPIASSQIYTALKTGVVDGLDSLLPPVKDSKYYEVTRQIVLTGHLVELNYLVLSKRIWDGLAAGQKAVVQKAAEDASELGRRRQLKLEAELEQFFKDKGLKVYTPDVEAFRAQVQKAYQTSAYARTWPQGMVEKINALHAAPRVTEGKAGTVGDSKVGFDELEDLGTLD